MKSAEESSMYPLVLQGLPISLSLEQTGYVMDWIIKSLKSNKCQVEGLGSKGGLVNPIWSLVSYPG